jgi:hypothetical protein
MALNKQLFSSCDSSVTVERIHDYGHVCLVKIFTDIVTCFRIASVIARDLLWTEKVCSGAGRTQGLLEKDIGKGNVHF